MRMLNNMLSPGSCRHPSSLAFRRSTGKRVSWTPTYRAMELCHFFLFLLSRADCCCDRTILSAYRAKQSAIRVSGKREKKGLKQGRGARHSARQVACLFPFLTTNMDKTSVRLLLERRFAAPMHIDRLPAACEWIDWLESNQHAEGQLMD